MSNILEDTIVDKGCINTAPSGGGLTFKNLIATSTDTTSSLVNSGATFLHAIIVNTTAAGAVTIYDGVGPTTGTKVGTLKASVVEGTYTYNVPLSTGLTVTAASNSDITIVYKDL
jgi:hypothetical protein